MKRVGIVTWHYNPNYGSLLQAYALQEVIRKLGYQPEFVNYRPDMNTFSKRVIRQLKDVFIWLVKPEMHTGRKKKKRFIREKLHVGQKCYSYNALTSQANDVYDIGICGSDQIWSNNAGTVNPLYYLAFLEEHKRISYAPSIGYDEIPNELSAEFRKYINRIRFLSVREERGAEIIRSETGRDAKVVLDPSLLMRKEEWLREIERKPPVSPKHKFILIYFLGNNEEHLEYAKRFSKHTGYEIVALGTKSGNFEGLKTLSGDPFDFVELIHSAEYVLTDSFHGVAFSINLGKQFAAFKRFVDDDPISQNSRIYNILKKTGLEERLITTDTPITFLENTKIDYSKVSPLLEAERKSSLDFLSTALETVANGR